MGTELRPYPRMKDSGVEWLGVVPAHWELRSLGQIGSFFKGRGGTKEDEVEVGVPCIRYGDLYTRHRFFVTNTRACVAHEAAAAKYTAISYGDILFAGSGETLDEIGKSAVNLIRGRVCCGGDVIVFRPTIDADPRFLGYASDCPASVWQKACLGQGLTVMHVYSGELKYMGVAIPPLPEQRAIARFLDHADRRIQRYIRAKERLIELLEEQKQAIIHQAVTGQIDVQTGQPYPAYRDSGVEWLREVPEHWEVRRLKALCDMQSGDTITAMSIEESGEYPVYGGNGLRGYTSTYTHDGDFALVGRQGALCGNIHLAHGRFWASEHAVVATLRRGHVLDWFGVLLRVMDLNQYSIAAAQPGLSVDRVMNLWVPVPPNREQRWIAERLVERSSELQGAVVATGRQTALLHEYRTRLIADVVTGKLDVREAAARLPATESLAGDRDPTDTIPTEPDLHSTAHYMAKEASA